MVNKIPKHFIDFIESKGISKVEILETSFHFRKKGIEKWQDLVWYFLQKLHLESAQNVISELEFYNNQRDFYLEMLYLRRKSEGRKANDIQSLLNQTRAQIANSSRLQFELKVVGDKRCDYSMKLSTRLFEMDKGIKGEVIETENCTSPVGCTCVLTFIAKRNRNGNLIK